MNNAQQPSLVKALLGIGLFIAVVTIPIYVAMSWFGNTWKEGACPGLLATDEVGVEFRNSDWDKIEPPFGVDPSTKEQREQMAAQMEQMMAGLRAGCDEYMMNKSR